MEFARNVVIFGVDNSSSSHADNHINNFLVLDEGPTLGINGSFGSPVKKFRINFTLHYSAGNFYLFFNGKEVFKFKADKKC